MRVKRKQTLRILTLSYQKKDGVATCAHSSFGMTITKTLRSVFLWCVSHDSWQRSSFMYRPGKVNCQACGWIHVQTWKGELSGLWVNTCTDLERWAVRLVGTDLERWAVRLVGEYMSQLAEIQLHVQTWKGELSGLWVNTCYIWEGSSYLYRPGEVSCQDKMFP